MPSEASEVARHEVDIDRLSGCVCYPGVAEESVVVVFNIVSSTRIHATDCEYCILKTLTCILYLYELSVRDSSGNYDHVCLFVWPFFSKHS